MHAATASTTGWIETNAVHEPQCLFCGDPAGALSHSTKAGTPRSGGCGGAGRVRPHGSTDQDMDLVSLRSSCPTGVRWRLISPVPLAAALMRWLARCWLTECWPAPPWPVSDRSAVRIWTSSRGWAARTMRSSGVRSLVRATVYRASLSWWSPERLSRTRMVWPLEAGMGRRQLAWQRRHGHRVVLLARRMTWSVPVRTKHGRTVRNMPDCHRAVRLLHQASSSDRAGAGSRGRTSPARDTTRVSHPQGHIRRHQFQPGIITEPRAVS